MFNPINCINLFFFAYGTNKPFVVVDKINFHWREL